jgi:hypothetical protein
MFEPRYDQEDLARFIDYLEGQLTKDEQVIRLEIINSSAATFISVEPTGAADEFPTGSRYEVVALVKKDKPYLIIETGETHVIVWANNCAAVFDKGVATLAYQHC